MKLFTVRDFIAYNNPCFACGDNIIFTFTVCDQPQRSAKRINPIITPTHTMLTLKIAYRELVELSIEHKSNKIEVCDMARFENFLKERYLAMSSQCSNCSNEIESLPLSLSSDKTRFSAVGIEHERLIVEHGHYLYKIFTSNNKSGFYVFNRKTGDHITITNAPALHLHKLKSKENMIEKFKLYLTFS